MVEIDGFNIGLGICYDAGFPEFVRQYRRDGADAVIFASAFLTGPQQDRYNIYHAARAVENGLYVAVSNALGDVAGQDFFGQGYAVDPYGAEIVRLNDQSGIVIFDINREFITKARSELLYLEDLQDQYQTKKL